jgi:hypothetical protein
MKFLANSISVTVMSPFRLSFLTRRVSDTNSRDDTNRGATTRDRSSGNDCSRSTSTGPQLAVKRVLRQVETLRTRQQ